MPTDRRDLVCQGCGILMHNVHYRQRYCKACSDLRKKAAVVKHHQKRAAMPRSCKRCGTPLESHGSAQYLCTACRRASNRGVGRPNGAYKAYAVRTPAASESPAVTPAQPSAPSGYFAVRRGRVIPVTNRTKSVDDVNLAASQMGISYGKLSELLRQEEYRQQEEQQAKLAAARAKMQAQAAAADTNVGDKEVNNDA